MADVKRNDIGATAACYANAYIGKTDMPDGARRRPGAHRDDQSVPRRDVSRLPTHAARTERGRVRAGQDEQPFLRPASGSAL